MKKLKIILLTILLMPGINALAQKTINDEYPTAMGHLQINTPQVNLNTINYSETRTDTLKIYNVWNQKMSLSILNLPEHITCKLIPELLLPNQSGIVVITYDASKSNNFGPVFESISISTNDSVQLQKPLYIIANIVEDFSKLTAEQLQNAAKIKFENTTFNFGTIKEGEKIITDFIFTNEGNDELFIRKVKAGCGCTAANADKSQLMKNEKSFIHVLIDTKKRAGQFHKMVTVYCNDPEQSIITLNINGKVEKAEESDLPKK